MLSAMNQNRNQTYESNTTLPIHLVENFTGNISQLQFFVKLLRVAGGKNPIPYTPITLMALLDVPRTSFFRDIKFLKKEGHINIYNKDEREWLMFMDSSNVGTDSSNPGTQSSNVGTPDTPLNASETHLRVESVPESKTESNVYSSSLVKKNNSICTEQIKLPKQVGIRDHEKYGEEVRNILEQVNTHWKTNFNYLSQSTTFSKELVFCLKNGQDADTITSVLKEYLFWENNQTGQLKIILPTNFMRKFDEWHTKWLVEKGNVRKIELTSEEIKHAARRLYNRLLDQYQYEQSMLHEEAKERARKEVKERYGI